MSQRQLLAKRIGLVALTNLLVEANTLIMLPLLTKNLPISEYGVWVQISVTIGLIPAVALLGLPYSMVRFLPSAKGRENIQEIFYSMAAIIAIAGLVAATGIFLLAEPIASALFDGRQNIVEALSILVFLECLISIPFAYLRGVQQIKKYSAFNFGKVFISLVLVIYFVLSGKGILGAVMGLIFADILIFLAMSSFVFSDVGASFPKFKNIREHLVFGMPTIPGNLSSWIVNSSNRYVIGLLMGTTFVGYFSPGYTLGNMINLFIAPLSFILPAALSKHYDEHETEEVIAILGFSLKFFLALGIPAAFGLSLLSRPILNVLSTPEIAAQGYMITPFMALGALFLGAYAIVAQIMVLEKNTVLTGKIWIIAAVLNLGSSFLLITYVGIIGGAIATLISFAFVFITTSYYAKKSIKISFHLNFVAKSLVASLAMSFLLLILRPEGVAGLALSIAIGALMYFIVLLALKGFTKEEIAFIRTLRYNK
ncbi:MAG: oligosaccharide flippase family protein [Methanothrix sp.]|nr:oligosaccharide flippase family protein [Methanothrix sp.]